MRWCEAGGLHLTAPPGPALQPKCHIEMKLGRPGSQTLFIDPGAGGDLILVFCRWTVWSVDSCLVFTLILETLGHSTLSPGFMLQEALVIRPNGFQHETSA